MEYLDHLIENISECINHNDSHGFRELLYDNMELTRNQHVYSKFWAFTVKELATSNNEEMIHVFIDFLEPELRYERQKQLIIAVLKGDLEKAKSLFDNGLRIIDPPGYWELHFPAIYCSVLRKTESRGRMLRLLLENGLNIYIRTSDAKNLYHLVADRNIDGAELAEILYEYNLHDVDADFLSNEKTPLFNACISKDIGLVAFFLSKDPDVKRSSESTWCFPLTAAFKSGNEEIVDLLISHGADVNAKDNEINRTIMHDGCIENWLDEFKLKLMIKKGADLNIADIHQRTPMMYLRRVIRGWINPKYFGCLLTMIKVLAISGNVSRINSDFIDSTVDTSNMYASCREEIRRMNMTRFYSFYTYDMVLQWSKSTKNLVKLSKLMKNKGFVANFENGLSMFPIYADVYRTILNDAARIRDEWNIVLHYLKLCFGSDLPELVLYDMAKYMRFEDIKFDKSLSYSSIIYHTHCPDLEDCPCQTSDVVQTSKKPRIIIEVLDNYGWTMCEVLQ